MAQGEFTKEEAVRTETAFTEVFRALSKKKQMEFVGHANNVYLFLDAAKKAAPSEVKISNHRSGLARRVQRSLW